MKPHAFLLDAVGTILVPREPVGTVYARAATAHGALLDAHLTGRAFREIFRTLPPPPVLDSPSPDDERDWWRALVDRIFDRFESTRASGFDREACFDSLYKSYASGDAWRVFPEVPAFLDRCRREGLPLALVSNFDRRLHGILRDLGLDTSFDAVLVSSEIGARKPHPRIFEAALRALGRAPGEVLHIGDDPEADWQGARRAGIPAFELDRQALTLDAVWLALDP